jgi:hypothetical protein
MRIVRVYTLAKIRELFRENGISGRTLTNLKREGIAPVTEGLWNIEGGVSPCYPADKVDEFIAMVKK